jgi:hypothetical protein
LIRVGSLHGLLIFVKKHHCNSNDPISVL